MVTTSAIQVTYNEFLQTVIHIHFNHFYTIFSSNLLILIFTLINNINWININHSVIHIDLMIPVRIQSSLGLHAYKIFFQFFNVRYWAIKVITVFDRHYFTISMSIDTIITQYSLISFAYTWSF